MTVTVSKSNAYAALLSPVMSVSKQTAYVVLIPIPAQHLDPVEFSAEGFLEFAAGPRVFPETVQHFSVEFTGSGFLGISARRVPPFDCEVPEVTEWTRGTPGASPFSRLTPVTTTWTCVGEEPAETDFETLAYVDGTECEFLDGETLKLIG